MCISYPQHFTNLFKRNKIAILAFSAFSVLSIVLAFLKLPIYTITLPMIAVAAVVLIIIVMITELKCAFTVLKGNFFDEPKRYYLISALSTFIVISLALSLALGCYGAAIYSVLTDTSTEYAEEFDQEQTYTEEELAVIEETEQALYYFGDAAREKGYLSPYLYVALFISLIISLLESSFLFHTAVAISSKTKWPPVLTMIVSLIGLNLLGQTIISLLTALLTASSPGMLTALNEISAVVTAETNADAAESLRALADSLPKSETLVKVIIISGLCTLVTTFTNGLIGMTFLKGTSKQQ